MERTGRDRNGEERIGEDWNGKGEEWRGMERKGIEKRMKYFIKKKCTVCEKEIEYLLLRNSTSLRSVAYCNEHYKKAIENGIGRNGIWFKKIY